MARASTNKTPKKRISKINLTLTSSQRLVMGSFLIIIGILLFTALLSYLFTGENDQSTIGEFTNRATQTENWLSKIGAWISELLIYKGFGISSFIFSGLIFLSGVSVCL
jgi:S-DNA-T family DNA segregation ATPase FtsK/SpoIIIE